jgi:hypothetical protein
MPGRGSRSPTRHGFSLKLRSCSTSWCWRRQRARASARSAGEPRKWALTWHPCIGPKLLARWLTRSLKAFVEGGHIARNCPAPQPAPQPFAGQGTLRPQTDPFGVQWMVDSGCSHDMHSGGGLGAGAFRNYRRFEQPVQVHFGRWLGPQASYSCTCA